MRINNLGMINPSEKNNVLEDFFEKSHLYKKNRIIPENTEYINIFTLSKPIAILGDPKANDFESNDHEFFHEFKFINEKRRLRLTDSCILMTISTKDKNVFRSIHSTIEKEIKKRVRYNINTTDESRIWDEEENLGHDLLVGGKDIAGFNQQYYDNDEGGLFLAYFRIFENPKTIKKIKSFYNNLDTDDNLNSEASGIKNLVPGLSLTPEKISESIYVRLKESV